MVGSLDENTTEEPVVEVDFAIPIDEEFRFTCKICGTYLYANESRVGTKTQCPDCYSEFLVPKPMVKKKEVEIKLDEAATVTFSPIDTQNSKESYNPHGNTKDILDRAAIEAEREREGLEEVNFTFDTKRWFGLIFGFLRDPFVVVAMLLLGLSTSAWLFSMTMVGTVLQLNDAAGFVVRSIIIAVFVVPISYATFLFGLPVLVMAANRAP